MSHKQVSNSIKEILQPTNNCYKIGDKINNNCLSNRINSHIHLINISNLVQSNNSNVVLLPVFLLPLISNIIRDLARFLMLSITINNNIVAKNNNNKEIQSLLEIIHKLLILSLLEDMLLMTLH